MDSASWFFLGFIENKGAKTINTISLPLYTINTCRLCIAESFTCHPASFTCFLVLSWYLASCSRWLNTVSSLWLFPLTLGQIQDTDMHKYPHICQHLPVKFQGCQLWDVPDLKRHLGILISKKILFVWPLLGKEGRDLQTGSQVLLV